MLRRVHGTTDRQYFRRLASMANLPNDEAALFAKLLVRMKRKYRKRSLRKLTARDLKFNGSSSLFDFLLLLYLLTYTNRITYQTKCIHTCLLTIIASLANEYSVTVATSPLTAPPYSRVQKNVKPSSSTHFFTHGLPHYTALM